VKDYFRLREFLLSKKADPFYITDESPGLVSWDSNQRLNS
jgi:hypothetical protein